MNITKEDIQAMTVEERRQLLEMLWESFEEGHEPYIDEEEEETEEELNLLQERLEEYKKDPSTAIPWEELKKQLMTGKDNQ